MNKLMCKIIGMKLKSTFGGKLRFFGIGGAKLDPETGEGEIIAKGPNVMLGSSGENIYPEEIENVINGIEEVNESVVMQGEDSWSRW